MKDEPQMICKVICYAVLPKEDLKSTKASVKKGEAFRGEKLMLTTMEMTLEKIEIPKQTRYK